MNKFDLANHIINKYPNEVSIMKLQKLVYYAYAWQLVIGEKYFEASFKAWSYGPVESDIYNKYKSFGKDPIKPDYESFLGAIPDELDFIIDSYAVFSAIELSKTTHFEIPWKIYKGTDDAISDDSLINYYKKQPFVKNFPLSSQKEYYPPKTASHYSFTFDMDKDYLPVYKNLKDFTDSFKSAMNHVSHELKKIK